MVVYIIISVCGYLMYGTNVSDEVSLFEDHAAVSLTVGQISKDLATTPGFSPTLNKLAVWTVAVQPITKLPLGLRPVSLWQSTILKKLNDPSRSSQTSSTPASSSTRQS
jgi:vesicular inhibitory amino acid transporter